MIKKEVLISLGVASLLTGIVYCFIALGNSSVVADNTVITEDTSSVVVSDTVTSDEDTSSFIDRRIFTEDFSEYSPKLPDKNDKDSSSDTNSEEIAISELLDKTKDGVGWLQIPDANIDYPVVHTSNNWYYLNHNAYGDYQYNGSLFMDYRNNVDLNDFITLIYGHNMKDFQLFANLDWYTDKDFFDNHRWIWYVDREYVYSLEVLCCGLVEDGSYIFDVFDLEETTRDSYLYDLSKDDSLLNKAEDLNLSSEDKYVMLCTCTDTMGSNGRYGKIFVVTRVADKHSYKNSDDNV